MEWADIWHFTVYTYVKERKGPDKVSKAKQRNATYKAMNIA